VSYADWHDEPGYFRDITRHFVPTDNILDVGCGTAWLADHFRSHTGVDASSEMVARAAERARRVVHGDASDGLPFESSTFDGVILKDLLEHVSDPVMVVRESWRVLKPGGRVYASSPDAQRWAWDDYTHRRPFTRRSFRLLFRDGGFEIEKLGYESVLPGTGILAARTRRKRRPRLFLALAWIPILRRNIWILARKPAS
jgi:SAM-dependent methyltransferase